MTDGAGGRQQNDLEWLQYAASTAEEAARWLRNSLIRIRTGHEAQIEIHTAERALQVALERLNGTPLDADADGEIRRNDDQRRGEFPDR